MNILRTVNTLAIAAMLVALACPAPGIAATFGISPMRIQLSASSPTAVVNVSNGGGQPLTIQLRAYAWSQPDGADVYTETRGFILSPPIFTIAPGETQVVRIAQRAAMRSDVERAYRLVFAEVPQIEEAASGEMAFRIAIHMNLPMYVAPTSRVARAEPVLSTDGDADRMRLRIDNRGSGNLRLADVVVEQEGARLADRDVLVVLPGASRFIELPRDLVRESRPLKVRATAGNGPIDVSVPLSRL